MYKFFQRKKHKMYKNEKRKNIKCETDKLMKKCKTDKCKKIMDKQTL